MSLNPITATAAAAYTQQTGTANTKSTKQTEKADTAAAAANTKDTEKSENTKKTDNDTAVIYEKHASSSTGKSTSHAAVIAQLKADSEARTAQLQSLVEKMLAKQGQTLATADDMWSFLAKGNLKADPETIAQAQKDVAADGYWGAEQTSDRILSFAKALAGDDPEKADELLNAFKKGYKQATKTWGSDLPSLCSDTYDLVEKKFNEWKNSSKDTADTSVTEKDA